MNVPACILACPTSHPAKQCYMPKYLGEILKGVKCPRGEFWFLI